MLIYNITVKVDHEMVADWMQWQKQVHIPEMIETGCFYEHRFYELLGQEEEDGKTFVIQFLASSQKEYLHYLENFAPGLRQKSIVKWQDHVVAFRSLLQNVE